MFSTHPFLLLIYFQPLFITNIDHPEPTNKRPEPADNDPEPDILDDIAKPSGSEIEASEDECSWWSSLWSSC